LLAGGAGFFAGELMRMATLVRGTAAQAGDLPLALRIHRGEAAQRLLGGGGLEIVGVVVELRIHGILALVWQVGERSKVGQRNGRVWWRSQLKRVGRDPYRCRRTP